MRAYPLSFNNTQEYDSTSVEGMGWKSSTVLLICLPVFLTVLAYTVILFIEVALKKHLLTERPIRLLTTTTATGAPPATAGQPSLAADKYADKGTGQQPGIPLDPSNPNPPSEFTPGLATNAPRPGDAMGTGITTTAPPTTAKVSDETIEPYLWEELLVYLAIHIVCLIFAVQPAAISTGHRGLSIALAWIHLGAICGYAFVAVDI